MPHTRPQAKAAVKEERNLPPKTFITGITKSSSVLNPEKMYARFAAEDEVLRRGPKGAPVYDHLGFELDYKKIAASRKPYSRSARRKMWSSEEMEKSRKKEERKCQIMGMNKNQVSAMTLMAWDDRVSRDLGIPYHKVEMQHFEDWHRRGFAARPGEFEAINIPKEECDRINELAIGSAFRK